MRWEVGECRSFLYATELSIASLGTMLRRDASSTDRQMLKKVEEEKEQKVPHLSRDDHTINSEKNNRISLGICQFEDQPERPHP